MSSAKIPEHLNEFEECALTRIIELARKNLKLINAGLTPVEFKPLKRSEFKCQTGPQRQN